MNLRLAQLELLDVNSYVNGTHGKFKTMGSVLLDLIITLFLLKNADFLMKSVVNCVSYAIIIRCCVFIRFCVITFMNQRFRPSWYFVSLLFINLSSHSITLKHKPEMSNASWKTKHIAWRCKSYIIPIWNSASHCILALRMIDIFRAYRGQSRLASLLWGYIANQLYEWW